MNDGLVYDALVVGGGPSGLTCALQLARFNRTVICFDSGMGRSTYHQINHNYLGFPGGISAREFRDIARKQVEAYPVAFVNEAVTSVHRDEGRFVAQTASGGEYRGRTIVLATGVSDRFPMFPEWESYVGRSVFWCITCDGYSTRGRRLVIVGNDTDAAVTALQFTLFTDRVVMLTNATDCGIAQRAQDALQDHGIPLVVDVLDHVLGNDGILGKLVLRSGRELPLDFLFSLQGCSPNSELGASLRVDLSSQGYLLANQDQQTNVPGVFAAGDVTRDLAHQVATAVHEGLTAATAANYYLYTPAQQHETYE